ncbi:MAG: hypothetical protein P8Z70_13930, partial [Desulfuromonadales bacterium]
MSLSLLLQVVSAYLGWQMVRAGRNRFAWTLSAAAMTLVALFSTATLLRPVAFSGVVAPKGPFEPWVVLLLSLVVACALWRFSPNLSEFRFQHFFDRLGKQPGKNAVFPVKIIDGGSLPKFSGYFLCARHRNLIVFFVPAFFL